MKSVVTFLAIVCAAAIPLHAGDDASEIVRTALTHAMTKTVPYVGRAVLHDKTERLVPLEHSSWPPAACTAAPSPTRLHLSNDDVPRVIVANLERFRTPDGFSWTRFAESYGDAWTVHVGTPAVLGGTAYLRLDLARPGKRPLQGEVSLRREAKGWRVVNGAFR